VISTAEGHSAVDADQPGTAQQAGTAGQPSSSGQHSELGTTRRLLDWYAADPSMRWPDRTERVAACARTILRYGSVADAHALLPAFLADPPGRPGLLPVLARHGDAAIAERLVADCFDGDRLRPDVPEGVLHAVGYLGREDATGLLWAYLTTGDWSAQREACRGLIHLSCRDIAAQLEEALSSSRGRSTFTEYLPALAAKTGDPAWPAALREWGDTAASTDCNGGLLLGLALYGEAGRDHFDQALWSPRWEAYSFATGSAQATYAGTRILGIGLADLVGAMHVRQRAADLPSRVSSALVLVSLVESWITRDWCGLRAAAAETEPAIDLFDLLFERGGGDAPPPLDRVAERILNDDPGRPVAGSYPLEKLRGQVAILKRRLERRVEHEVELAELGARD
jgi:hypothetical protein